MTTVPISVVIVNFNGADHLARCLDSVAASLAGGVWNVVVVDNASTDGSERAVSGYASRVRLVRNAENIGFARAVNLGVSLTSTPLVLVLNPDCRIQNGAVQALESELLRDSRCGAVGPTLLNPDGTLQGNARGDPNLLTGLFGRSALLTRVFPRLPIVARNVRRPDLLPPGARSMEVDWLSGACMLVKREAFEQVGGFDDRYFLYWEDADFGRRLRARGYGVRYVPGACAVHVLGQSARSVPELAIREFHRSAYLYYTSHVARSEVDPRSWIARRLLGARCRWQLWRVRRRGAAGDRTRSWTPAQSPWAGPFSRRPCRLSRSGTARG